MSANIPFISSKDIATLFQPNDAVRAIRDLLLGGFDPSGDPARVVTELSHGQFLLMPSEIASSAGVKVATVSPGNPSRGLPRVQALYLLMDASTLTPLAILDGTPLTTLRTSAVSIAAISPILEKVVALNVAICGSGPQAVAHLETIYDWLPEGSRLASATYLARSPEHVSVPSIAGSKPAVVGIGTAEATQTLHAADVIICATSAQYPIFDSSIVKDSAIVIAVGSHEPHAREVDGDFCGRATVLVEDTATALRESGDVILAIQEGHITADDLVPMADFLTQTDYQRPAGPIFFKSSGMAWEDLVIASAIFEKGSYHQ